MSCRVRTRELTEPAREPVTLEEARLWARVDPDDTTQDAMLLLCIKAARRQAENITGRTFVERTFETSYDYFPSHVIEIPRVPLQSISYITYLDVDGLWQTLAGSPEEFLVDTNREPGLIMPLFAEVWPTTYGQRTEEVKIGYTAGYATIEKIPATLKLWMQMKIATFDAFREHLAQGQGVSELPRSNVDGLLDELIVGTQFGR